MSIILPVEPLTRESFAIFGDVVEAVGPGNFPVNAGTAQRFHALATLDPGAEGQAIVNIFRGSPWPLPLTIRMMERHPLGTQLFMPLEGRPYLVVVAPAGPAPATGQLRAFLATGHQGVHYGRGVWHHPLLALESTSDFLMVERAGPGTNCDEIPLDTPAVIDVKAVRTLLAASRG